MSNLYNNILNQSNFTGRINIQDNLKGQYIGEILFKEGQFSKVLFHQAKGFRALLAAVVMDQEKNYKIIVEPELVEGGFLFEGKSEDILKKLKKSVADYNSLKHLRPFEMTKLAISSHFFEKENLEISVFEFDLLCIISDYNRVFDIYEKANIFDFEVTINLIKLRKKGILKVIK